MDWRGAKGCRLRGGHCRQSARKRCLFVPRADVSSLPKSSLSALGPACGRRRATIFCGICAGNPVNKCKKFEYAARARARAARVVARACARPRSRPRRRARTAAVRTARARAHAVMPALPPACRRPRCSPVPGRGGDHFCARAADSAKLRLYFCRIML